VYENPNQISNPDFDSLLLNEINSHMYLITNDDNYESCESSYNISVYLSNTEIENLINETIEFFHLSYYPYRSQEPEIIDIPNVTKINKQIQYLLDIPQPAQRTEEWYNFRNNMITASNAYKALEESQAVQNQLIYEKCNNKVISSNNNDTVQYVNINSPFHWGQKYEPVAVMLYELINNTVITDFGCIQHNKYSYIGASPDGINTDKSSHLYGRMLEIKCVVSRELTGIPKKEYWVQMQMQMETCDLNECDFLEIDFKEYDDYNTFNQDNLENDYEYNNKIYNNKSNNGNYKGMIMYFGDDNGNPIYKYKPIGLTIKESIKWENAQMSENSNLMWIRNIYWYIKDISNVLVLRNTVWFDRNKQGFEKIWDTIIHERINGYDHRKPNKRCTIVNKIKDKPSKNCDNELITNYFVGGAKMDIDILI
jgi:putative phage-type endonuclease